MFIYKAKTRNHGISFRTPDTLILLFSFNVFVQHAVVLVLRIESVY